jgi:hypothetical protein
MSDSGTRCSRHNGSLARFRQFPIDNRDDAFAVFHSVSSFNRAQCGKQIAVAAAPISAPENAPIRRCFVSLDVEAAGSPGRQFVGWATYPFS